MSEILSEVLPILLLLAAITVVMVILPKVDVGHDKGFRARRVLNWVPVGMAYMFLYMGRYNLTVAKGVFEEMTGADGQSLMTNADFGIIFGAGTLVYGSSFLINGPLVDRIGGRKALLIGATGSLFANFAMGLVIALGYVENLRLVLSVIYAVNMYFQSFGAVSIVKINASWFHVRERGVFGAIFGILISLGIYFAFDVTGKILAVADVQWAFFTPSIALAVMVVAVAMLVKDTPALAGLGDFDPKDASSGDDGPRLPARVVLTRMLTNPVIMTIAAIEFCSGFLRQAIMQWYRTYAKAIGEVDGFVYENWGMMLCCAGILGGVFAGTISDHIFGSRRGPVAAVLYGGMLLGAVLMIAVLGTPTLPWLIVMMSMCIIGVHGMLSGTASMDFGGRKNVGTAVGIIDGFVYAGTGVMSFTYGALLPEKGSVSVLSDWIIWPVTMVPLAVIGLVLSLRVWNAKPKPKVIASRPQ